MGVFREQDAKIWWNSAQGLVAEVDDQYKEFPFLEISSAYWAKIPEYKPIYLSTYLWEMMLLDRLDEGWANINTLCESEACLEYFANLREILSVYQPQP